MRDLSLFEGSQSRQAQGSKASVPKCPAMEDSQCEAQLCREYQPGKPVACNYGLLSVNYGLLWSIVAYFLGLLGVPRRL